MKGSLLRRGCAGTLQPSASAFTLVELLVIVSILGIAAVLSLLALRQSRGDAALRQAAVELSGYLQSARSQSATATSSCQLSLSAGLVLGPSAGASNSCAGLASVDLRAVSGLAGLTASGDTSYTFLARGLTAAAFTTVLQDASSSRQACVHVSTPAGLVKRGSRASSAASCDYVSGY